MYFVVACTKNSAEGVAQIYLLKLGAVNQINI